jgi:hypothetical protein
MYGGVIEVEAGPVYESSQRVNGYHFISVACETQRVHVRPRRWDDKRRDWIPNLNAFQAEAGDFPLRERWTERGLRGDSVEKLHVAFAPISGGRASDGQCPRTRSAAT